MGLRILRDQTGVEVENVEEDEKGFSMTVQL